MTDVIDESGATFAPIERPKVNRSRTVAGLALTGAYLIAMAIYVSAQWPAFLTMTSASFGDFLAGVFAPLAFLWLVLGFFQQGDELRHSADALWLQGEELRNSVQQQKEMVRLSAEQLEFERENFAAQIAEARRRAQLNLAFEGGGFSTHGENTSMDFKLVNRGPACSDIRLTISETEEVKRGPLGTGEQMPFQVLVTPDHPLGDRAFKIEYTDGLGNPGEETLLLELSYSGGRKILALPD